MDIFFPLDMTTLDDQIVLTLRSVNTVQRASTRGSGGEAPARDSKHCLKGVGVQDEAPARVFEHYLVLC